MEEARYLGTRGRTAEEPPGEPVVIAIDLDEVDLSNAAQLEQVLVDTTRGPAPVIADFGGVRFMSSSGATALIRAHTALQQQGATLLLAACVPSVTRVITLCGLDQLIPCLPTVEEARQALAEVR